MSVIDIDLVMAHLLAEPEDQLLVQTQLDAAEESAAQYLQRRFYVDQAAVDAAKTGVKSRMATARDAYNASLREAQTIENYDDRWRYQGQAQQMFDDARAAVDMDAAAIVINPAITAACLLKVGHLFANREEVVVGSTVFELPQASKSLLAPYRIGMGV